MRSGPAGRLTAWTLEGDRMTSLSPGVHLFGMPMCAACEAWAEFLAVEGFAYTAHDLADMPALIGSSVPEELLRSITRRSIDGDAWLVAPVVVNVRADRSAALIAEGIAPWFKFRTGMV